MAKVKTTVVEFGPVFYLPPDSYDLAAEFTVYGEPGRKSNQRRIVRNNSSGKPMIIKSQKAMAYAENFIVQVPGDARLGLGSAYEPLALWCHIYYASNRPDISSELIQDLLEKAGVVSNDRWIKTVILFGAIDKVTPRTELRLYRIREFASRQL